jgi:signal transduction histidine kinase
MGLEIRQKRRDGSVFYGSVSFAPIWVADNSIAGVMGTVEDVSDRIEREKAHQKIQAQLLQAQKMESVGRLAGGVAHDYNNTLGVILGYAELMLESLDPDDPKHQDLQQIIKATLSSADITRQLLAFARKQTIAPKVLDLNRQVENLLKMLRRLIGENIELEWIPQANLGMVKMDPIQIDQILANLCVNARDAIEDTGKISIETRSVTVDEDYCRSHPEFRPGEFVCLTVSDTGSGIDEKILENIFEPFFTTKGKREGTGLGLSTVYGIVKQNNGFINVYSEPGKGTTFSIYLSRQWGEPAQEPGRNGIKATHGKGETVLLVEDDAAILEISKQILENLGYRVISSQNTEEAIARAWENKERLNLLITDVIMPTMNGLELANHIKSFCPDLKVIYMSGYTANVIAHRGILDDNVHFLQKPFSKNDVAKKVRSVLDA